MAEEGYCGIATKVENGICIEADWDGASGKMDHPARKCDPTKAKLLYCKFNERAIPISR